jgi:hypothetical protein
MIMRWISKVPSKIVKLVDVRQFPQVIAVRATVSQRLPSTGWRRIGGYAASGVQFQQRRCDATSRRGRRGSCRFAEMMASWRLRVRVGGLAVVPAAGQ